jgi:3-dehydroquinate dehydratase-2
MGMDTDNTGNVIPTVTLAKLYETQGFLDKAAAVYRSMLTLEPDRTELEAQLRDIETRLETRRAQPGKSEATTILSQLKKWHGAIGRRKKILVQWHGKRRRILVIHGPAPESVTEAGRLEPAWSDDVTLEQIHRQIKEAAEAYGMTAETFQSNYEGELVGKIRSASDGYDVLIINPTRYTYTSVAIKDALSTLDLPVIEVQPSNTCGQDPSSQKSLIAEVVTAHLAGFGQEGYVMAVRAAANMTGQEEALAGRP